MYIGSCVLLFFFVDGVDCNVCCFLSLIFERFECSWSLLFVVVIGCSCWLSLFVACWYCCTLLDACCSVLMLFVCVVASCPCCWLVLKVVVVIVHCCCLLLFVVVCSCL